MSELDKLTMPKQYFRFPLGALVTHRSMLEKGEQAPAMFILARRAEQYLGNVITYDYLVRLMSPPFLAGFDVVQILEQELVEHPSAAKLKQSREYAEMDSAIKAKSAGKSEYQMLHESMVLSGFRDPGRTDLIPDA